MSNIHNFFPSLDKTKGLIRDNESLKSCLFLLRDQLINDGET